VPAQIRQDGSALEREPGQEVIVVGDSYPLVDDSERLVEISRDGERPTQGQ